MRISFTCHGLRPKAYLLASVALAAHCLTPTARAQTVPPTPTPSWTGETIVVTGVREGYAVPNGTTATRTDTPLIETPQSVEVLNRALLDEQDRRTLADALVNVSGVIPTKPEEVLLTPPIVRGFPSEVYLDGLPIFGGNQQGFNPSSLVGVERIDVLKGPSSTLYGGGLGSPLGGLINIESERPTDTFGGYVAMRAGSFSTWNPYGDLNLPLGSGVNARIAAEYQSNGSWIDKVAGDHWSLQPSLSVQLGPDTDLLLKGQVNHTGQLEYSGLPAAQALAGQIDADAFPGAPSGQPRTMIDTQLASFQLRHDFNDALRLTVSGQYYGGRVAENGSFVYPEYYPPDPATPTAYPILPLTMLTTTKEGTVDANLLVKIAMLGGDHEVLAGIDYDRTIFDSGMGFNGVPVGVLDLANPAYTLAFGPLTPINLTQTDRYQTIAGYVQDQATYGPLHLVGALRLTHLGFRELEQATDKTYNHVSPRVGATFDLTPGIAAYAGYATAFRGSFAFIGIEPPKPETSSNYEAGLKLAMKDIGLSGTIAAFQQTRDNVATADPSNPLLSIQSGEQRARGFEADLVWEPDPAFSLLANYAYTEAEVTKDNVLPIGDTLPRVPKNSGRVAARYRLLDGIAKGLSFGAGVTAVSARQDTLPNSVWVPGYAMVDAQAAYEFGRYTIEVSAVNVGGSRAYDTYEYFGFPVVMPVQPRSAYVTLKARF